MGHEKHNVGEEIVVDSANPTDRVKSRQGVLSFRSRKLLRSSLSKRATTNNVSKPATLSLSTECADLERSSETHSKILSGDPTKACRKLWDSRTENDTANFGPLSTASKKLQEIQHVEDRQVRERPRTAEDGSSKAGISRWSSKQSKKLEGILPTEDQLVEEGPLKGDGVVVTPLTQQISPKFRLLEKFYESLEAACSLLRIRRQMCTFRAVCKIVESMSKRRFLLKHLAQIKHIFTEVLQLEYVRCQDPDNLTERWDLRVTLMPLSSDSPHTISPLKGSAGQTAQTVRRRKEFHVRLLSFERSHPEDEDIPLEPLPRRPLGSHSANWQPTVPPSSDPTFESCVSTPGGVSEASTQPPDAELPIQSRTEDFEFCIVKPSRGNDTTEPAGISHFSSSFRPFYSNIQSADVDDGAAVPSHETFRLESHFSASFRPSFAARTTPEAADCLPMQPPKRTMSDKSPLLGSRCEDKHQEIRIEPQVCDDHERTSKESGVCERQDEIRVEFKLDAKYDQTCVEPRGGSQDPIISSKFVSVSSSRLSDGGSQFSPCTPVASSYTKEQPKDSSGTGCPVLKVDELSFSPVPTHTPPLVSPMNRVFNSGQDSSSEKPCKAELAESFSNPTPPKSRGIMRSLRFASPVRSAPSVTAENSPIAREIVNSSVNTPPSGSRLDQTSFYTPSRGKNIPVRPPRTPSLQTPVVVNETKEVWCSPTKKTKLNRVSLFINDKDEHKGTDTPVSKIADATKSSLEASSERADHGGEYIYEARSMLRRSHPVLKETKNVSESDLDVIQCLPQDLVQSVLEKERKMKDETSRELAQLKRRQQMMGGVPKLFNQLRLIFQSLNRSVLPESELIRTILTSHPDITDKGEVVERLKLVIELAPEYINTRPSHSGELLYRVDKRADVVQIQRRLSGGGPSKKLF